MIEIQDIQHHRNGICGMPFTVVTFLWEGRSMVAVRFDDSTRLNPRIAVLDRGMLAEGNIQFGLNSWRGDEFAHQIDQAIQEKNDAQV